LLRTLRDLGREVQGGTERQEREILAAWREKDVLQIVDDVDVEAFRRRAREYFADGFPFSPLYRAISSQEASPKPAGSDAVPPHDPAEREEMP